MDISTQAGIPWLRELITAGHDIGQKIVADHAASGITSENTKACNDAMPCEHGLH